ncbi:UDP-N-acetylglucosamine transferase subunit ALG13 [Rhodococcus sp. AG1013]|uniref:glycosyltransferase n=1 Tax=Rhodococcus sp. AG1013 TaxID=2183996 RepID=UPI000E2C19C1|nr:glycosyltransferase [Rhodococcus sp. AG1013]RDI26791.1 UDP-N-acetylglucosamine transferase subunit ALG13 [Rhodococcus sp. AG1013]
MTEKHPLAQLVPPQARVLWVASSGGHFSQLMRIADAADAADDSDWVTFANPQTLGALDGKRAHFVDYIAPRDVKNAAKAARWAAGHLRNEKYDLCISTGAALAVSVLPVAAARGIETVYVESISRVDGPSLSGRMLQRFPRIRTFTQHEGWASTKWQWKGSILDSWAAENRETSREPKRFFVTLGTIRPYRFDRAIDAILAVLQPGDEVTWQLGCSERDDLPGSVHREVKPTEFRKLAQEADVTITHAGVGSILELLDMGITPAIVVRSQDNAEHVDNHQRQIAAAMTSRGLAFELDLEQPSRGTLVRAAEFGAMSVSA